MMKHRSAIEIMVIVFSHMLATVILLVATMIVVVKIVEPTADVDGSVAWLTSVVSATLAALLGLVAGKSETLNIKPPPEPEPPKLPPVKVTKFVK